MSGLEAVAWAWFERCGRPQEVKIVIDRELASKIDTASVMAWLESRGLVWMPKGLEFMVKKEKR